MASWAVAVTKPNYELRVEGHLTRQGFAVYAPKIHEQVIICGRVCHRQVPMFRRYIFVSFATAWEAITRTFGVVGLLRAASNKPATLPSEVIEELQLRHNASGVVQLPRFSVGERVRLLSGPFAGTLAIYQGMTSRQREQVLLASLGCRLQLSIGNLCRA